MNFNELVDRLMPFVSEASELPCAVWRRDNEWQFESVNMPPNKASEYLEGIKAQDPCAVIITGKDLAGASYPFVYDSVLSSRFRAEYENMPDNAADKTELSGLVNFLEDNFGALSPETTGYLSQYDRPLAALGDMLPADVLRGGGDKLLEAIESKISGLIERSKDSGRLDVSPEVKPDEPQTPPLMPEIKQKLYKYELKKIGFPGAAYSHQTGKMMLDPKNDRLPEINNAGDIHYDKKYSDLVTDEILPMVRRVNEMSAAWENSRPAPYEDVANYRILAGYNDIVLAARDDSEHQRGLYFVTWKDAGDGYEHGYYNYKSAKESFATRSGLVDKEIIITPEKAVTIKAALDLAAENSPSYELTRQLESIDNDLCEAYPKLFSKKDTPAREKSEPSKSERPSKKPATLKQKLDDGKKKAREAAEKKDGRGDKAKQRSGDPEVN